LEPWLQVPNAIIQTAIVKWPGNRSAYPTASVAAAFSVCTVISLCIYIGLCWKEVHDTAKNCTSGSPIVVEFVAEALVLVLFCSPWPLPMWTARRRLLWRAAQCFAWVCGPACGAMIDLVHVVVTDVLTSTGLLLWQFENSICLFTTSNWNHGAGQSEQGKQCTGEHSFNRTVLKSLIIALPFYLRMVQCAYLAIRNKDRLQLVNTFKCVCARCNTLLHTQRRRSWVPPLATLGHWVLCVGYPWPFVTIPSWHWRRLWSKKVGRQVLTCLPSQHAPL